MSHLNRETGSNQTMEHGELLAALSGAQAGAGRALGLRTRRAVFNAARDRREDRASSQRNLFIAVLITGGLTLLLVPAIWSGLQDILGGATLVDLPLMLVALGMMLFAGVGASLFLLSDKRHAVNGARHPRR